MTKSYFKGGKENTTLNWISTVIIFLELRYFPVDTSLLTQSSNGFKTPEKTNTFFTKSERPLFMEFPFSSAFRKQKGNINI